MKKYLIILAILIFIAIYSFSQERTLSGGVFVAPSISWMKPEISLIEKGKGRTGFSFGVLGDINITENFAFSLGVAANNVGGELKYLQDIPEFVAEDVARYLDSGSTIKYKLQYIEFPVSLKGKSKKMADVVSIYLKAGITPMIESKSKGEFTDSAQVIYKDIDIKKEINFFTLGYHIGGGAEISIFGNTGILVDLVFTNVFTDITNTYIKKTSQSSPDKDDKVIVNNVCFRVGLIF